jgi:hypothetical protein
MIHAPIVSVKIIGASQPFNIAPVARSASHGYCLTPDPSRYISEKIIDIHIFIYLYV